MFDVSLRSILEGLASQHLITGLVLAGAGLVFMLLGGRIYKGLVAISFGAFGFLIGLQLPVPSYLQILLGAVAGIGLAVASANVLKISVALLGGFWAGFAAYQLLEPFGVTEQVRYLLAGFAFAGAVALSFILFQEIVAFVTSLEGSLLFSAALVIFFSQNITVWSHIRAMMLESRFFLPFMIVAGTVTGYYLQITDVRHKDSGVSV